MHKGKKILLIVTRSLDGIYAYNVEKDVLEWKVEGCVEGLEKKMGLESVVTDGCGRIFVGDQANSCIQMFSADGVHLGFILKEENQVMVQTPRISWCNSVSSLLVGMMIQGQYHISMIQNIVGNVGVQRQVSEESTSSTEKEEQQAEDPKQDIMGVQVFTRENTELRNASIHTKSCTISYISTLPDGNIAVCGKVNEQWKLVQCYLHGGTELHSTLEEEPGGMTSVALAHRPCLAVSYK